MKKTKKVDEF